MVDRPAAELLAEWNGFLNWQDQVAFQERLSVTATLEGYARAEQALAAVEALADGWRDARPDTPPLTNQSAVVGWATGKLYEDELRAVLRAALGGNDD